MATPDTPISPGIGPATLPSGTLRVRMYRQGLGDCFLLSLGTADNPRHLLVDCGVFMGTPNARTRIQQVADNIYQTTQGRLDAVVVTHEHWDHVSGFADARDIFTNMTVEESWFAWTEDPNDTLAASLKTQARRQLTAIQAALIRLDSLASPSAQALTAAVTDVVSLFGAAGARDPRFGIAHTTANAMDFIRTQASQTYYWKPGDRIERSWLPGIRLYVLGPPRDPALLQQMAGRVGKDTYELTASDAGFGAALGVSTQDGLSQTALESSGDDAGCPFDRSLQWPSLMPPDKTKSGWPRLARAYNQAPWRQINEDWLSTAARLALQLDQATNNTSLVLAIELIASGKILLFTGDAQIGNWLSWKTLSWEIQNRSGERQTVRAADLLARTIFYKAGHHGSHNATLATGGLELMTDPSLVVAIPVDQAFANGSPRQWRMPAAHLYARLNGRAKGRILRADRTWPRQGDPMPEALTQQVWLQFIESVSHDTAAEPLYLDYRIEV